MEIKCSRTACQTIITGPPHYLIYNEPSTGQPRMYCISCGNKIVAYNPSLKFEKVLPEKP